MPFYTNNSNYSSVIYPSNLICYDCGKPAYCVGSFYPWNAPNKELASGEEIAFCEIHDDHDRCCTVDEWIQGSSQERKLDLKIR